MKASPEGHLVKKIDDVCFTLAAARPLAARA